MLTSKLYHVYKNIFMPAENTTTASNREKGGVNNLAKVEGVIKTKIRTMQLNRRFFSVTERAAIFALENTN
jgi:hypothetical protein